MMVTRTVADTRAAREAWRGHRVGFVPTMGALHAGHEALCHAARAECDRVAASVFVNPRQFDNPTDLSAYPRAEEADRRILDAVGVDLVFVPAVDDIYPPGHVTAVRVEGPAMGFEGAHRPGHFDGVATVCLTLFTIVRPDVVYLGQKDAQQVAVLRRLVHDLALDLTIRVVPTVRDADGLALSSRNARLSADERARALAIPRALRDGLAAHRRSADPVAAARAVLTGLDVEYVDVAPFDDDPTLVIAARLGATRLIDNVPLRHPERAGL